MKQAIIKINTLLKEYHTLKIKTQADVKTAADWLKAITQAIKATKEKFSKRKEEARAALKKITDKEKAELAPLQEAKEYVAGLLESYQTSMQHALQAEQSAEVRLLNAKIARRARKGQDTDELEDERAEALEQITVNAVSGNGLGVRNTTRAEVFDMNDFLRAALKDNRLHSFIEIDTPKLAKFCDEYGITTLPGVSFTTQQTIYSTSR